MTIPRIFEAPQKSFFLLGPRGVGKSTYLQIAFPDAHVINLLAEDTYQRLLANSGLLAAELRAVPGDRWVVLDEMQRLPALLNEVHRFIEERGAALCFVRVERKKAQTGRCQPARRARPVSRDAPLYSRRIGRTIRAQ